MSTLLRRPAALLLTLLAVSACSAGGSTVASPGSTPAASPSVQGIAHPTGPKDIVLRLDEAGGFVPPEFLASHVPQFTLYGDGTVVFVQGSAQVAPRADGVSVGQPVRTAKLTEEQVQALLEYAIKDGGLGIARAEYQNPLVADAPTAVFTLNADGAEKTVAVNALGMEDPQPNADTAVKQALAKLGERLRDFDQGGTQQSAPYEAAAYRGVLLPQEGLQGVTFREWPWTDLAPSGFTPPADPNALPQATATLTPAQAGALGIDGFENGIAAGVYLKDDAGKQYTFAMRPLLPDETTG